MSSIAKERIEFMYKWEVKLHRYYINNFAVPFQIIGLISGKFGEGKQEGNIGIYDKYGKLIAEYDPVNGILICYSEFCDEFAQTYIKGIWNPYFNALYETFKLKQKYYPD